MREEFDSIPKELREVSQWVNWKCITRNDKKMKLPIDPKTGDYASPTDHNTWGSFDIVRKRSDHLGFVFSEDDVFVGIDFDHCVTNGEIHPNVKNTMAYLNSYAEYSPSGTGIHILIKGKLTDSRKLKKDGRSIEIYSKGRFFTMTGNHIVGTPTEIHHRQEELDTIVAKLDAQKPRLVVPKKASNVAAHEDDAKVLQKAMNSKSGEKFTKLFNGDTAAYNDDHSAADYALVNMLWYWTNGNEDQVDRLFRKSGLIRDKWDEYHGTRTYGEITIDNVQR